MEYADIKKAVIDYAKQKLSNDSSGHDWWHTLRVMNIAVHLAKHEEADLHIVEIASLLHDVNDYKLIEQNAQHGMANVPAFLKTLGLDDQTIDRILIVVEIVTFTGAIEKHPGISKEALIVQDADRLDAIGAIGVARAFTFGGYKRHSIYTPDELPRMYKTFDAYKNRTSCTINHFYEKLLKLKDGMNTQEAKRIAENRHRFLEEFLKQFLYEWGGLMSEENAPTGGFSLSDLFKLEIEGKYKAQSGYDVMLWRIRAGYALVLYGSMSLIIAFAKNNSFLFLYSQTKIVFILLIVGFSCFAGFIDYWFLKRKLQVVQATDSLLDYAFDIATGVELTDPKRQELKELLHNAGEKRGVVYWEKWAARYPIFLLYTGTAFLGVLIVILMF